MTDSKRTASIQRTTRETDIRVDLNLDGSGTSKLDTGLPFFEHMLDQVARHGMVDLDISAKGDLHIDAHHTVEDVGITLGQAIAKAIGDKSGIVRYGHAYVPLDEALSRTVIDFSGRPTLEYDVTYPRERVGTFDVDLFREFFHGLCNHAGITLHISNLNGRNAHHIAETIFKSFGRALRMAAQYDPRSSGVIPSTKGSL
ncbi:MAG: imidazoleglycerol-phosphate dehydratase HisB [Gammaproteobacteria bacterium]|nr:imidazoleglycerol-phosphate dehydratase HisB [Gammaproteobacteria bacterium]